MKTTETTNHFKHIRDAVQKKNESFDFPPELPTTILMAVTVLIAIFISVAIII